MADNHSLTNCSGDGLIKDATFGEVCLPGLAILLALFALVGFLSNVLVAVTILKSRFLQDVTHYLILNLAISDGLCCFVFSLQMCMDLLGYPDNGTGQLAEVLYCRLFHGNYLLQSFAYISAYNLVVISLERYVGIVRPLRYVQLCRKSNVGGAVWLAWTLGFCAYSIHLFGVDYKPSGATFAQRCRLSHDWKWHLVPFLGGFIVPLLTMVWAYSRIIQALRKSALNQRVSRQVRETQEATRRVVHLMLLATVAYVILYIPTQPAYMAIVNVQRGHFAMTPLGTLLTKLLSEVPVLLNSFINPFIYAFKYKKFRRGVRAILCGRHRNGLVFGHGQPGNENGVPSASRQVAVLPDPL